MATMTVNQLAFPDLVASLHDAGGLPVDPASVSNQAFSSSDPSIVTMENRAPDGTPDATGAVAAVAQAVGVSVITFTGNNTDGSLVTLTDTMTITAVSAGPAVDGPLLFSAPITKPVVPTGGGRRR